MSPHIATYVFASVIAGLFWLDRDTTVKTSKALWIPVIWLFLNASRSTSLWISTFESGTELVRQNALDVLEDGNPIDRAVFTLLIATGIIVLLARRGRVRRLLQGHFAIFLFFSYCAVSALWSDYPLQSFKHFMKGLGDVAMVLIVLSDDAPEVALRRLLARLGFVLIPLSVLFVKYYPELGREYNEWTYDPMYSGVSTSKNMLGMVCLIFGLGSLWRLVALLTRRDEPRRMQGLLAHGVVLAMVFWLFFISNSMTSMACFCLAGGMVIVTNLKGLRRKPAIVHFAMASIVVVSAAVLFSGAGGGVLQTMGRDPTLTNRTAIWNLILGIQGNPLLGTGYESFWLGNRLKQVWSVYPGIRSAHNGYLDIYLNLGWIGVVLLVVVIAAGYKRVFAVLHQNPSLGSISLAYFVVAIVYNFTEAAFQAMFPVWVMFLLVILILPNSQKSNRSVSNRIDLTGIPSETLLMASPW